MLEKYILFKLRSECCSLHKSIENSYPFVRLLNGDMSPAELVIVLKKMYDLHSTIKTYLNSSLYLHPATKFIDKACRLEEIAIDLAYFNTNPDNSRIEVDLPFSIPCAIGVLYVILGSTLGGSVIGKSLSQGVDPNIRRAINFFVGDPSSRIKDWREFLVILESTKISLEDEVSIINGAKSTFVLVHDQFLGLGDQSYG